MIKWVLKPYVIIGVGVGVGVVTCVIRVLRQHNREEIEQTQTNRISRAIQIPKGFVGHVLGRGGSTIKGIREKSKARITFDDTGLIPYGVTFVELRKLVISCFDVLY